VEAFWVVGWERVVAVRVVGWERVEAVWHKSEN
jgi:hypothetical protein